MRYAIVNCDVYTGEKVLYDKGIIVNGNDIESIVDIDKISRDLDVMDLKGLNVASGFIDLQVNGGGGCLFNDSPTEEYIARIFSGHKHFGTTNFLPTLFTVSTKKMLQAIETVKACLRNNKYGVLGLHIEGPYINEKKAGVHDKQSIKQVSNDELNILTMKGEGVIKIWTVAPEIIDEYHIKKLNEHGIIVSAGHTNATYEQATESFGWGISKVTHIFNAMSQFGSREPGVVGAALDADKIWAGIIVVGFHVHFASVRICKKIKGKKLILITDAMPPVGSDITEFNLGELKVLYKNGQCTTEEGVLAGSSLDMATAVRNCVQKVGIPMDEALRMASTYPAECIGIGNNMGKIKPGYLANMVIFDNQLTVKATVSNGIYENVK